MSILSIDVNIASGKQITVFLNIRLDAVRDGFRIVAALSSVFSVYVESCKIFWFNFIYFLGKMFAVFLRPKYVYGPRDFAAR